jgi:hypothetical protein
VKSRQRKCRQRDFSAGGVRKEAHLQENRDSPPDRRGRFSASLYLPITSLLPLPAQAFIPPQGHEAESFIFSLLIARISSASASFYFHFFTRVF